MLGDSSTATGLGSSSGGDASAAVAVATHEGGGGSNSGEDDRNINNTNSNIKGEDFLTADRSFGGNRWPRQETLALLKIRSDMDVAFRDASVKGPLWDEVSRKLAELGYHRSAKKCKEKFENVYKYHKRTKEGRTGKSDGKTYRFFDQLEALENQLFSSSSPTAAAAAAQPKAQASAMQAATTMTTTTTTTTTTVAANTNIPPLPKNSTVPSISTPTPPMPSQGTIMNLAFQSPFQAAPTNPTILQGPPQPLSTTATNPTFPSAALHSISADLVSNSMTSSSTSSDEEIEEEETGGGGGRRKRKRKWKDFFERLMKEVIQRQEELQKKFLEAIEKREHERMAREEAWRMQEMSRINREREILAQERSIAAAKDAAVMSFLQKISEQQGQNPTVAAAAAAVNFSNIPQPPIIQPVQSTPPPPPPLQPQPISTPARPQPEISNIENVAKLDHNIKNIGGEDNNIGGSNNNNNNNNSTSNNKFMVGSASSSRWPKAEVHALIQLRTNLDAKYQENGPKGPLWEEISAAMRKFGYNRNAKRCKEKWENINKYFKKVKEQNKKRPEDSKTCPYFHQLDALYREKNKHFDSSPSATAGQQQFPRLPENSVPLMVQPEQQWPPATATAGPPPPGAAESAMDMETDEMERVDQTNHDEEDEDENEDEDDDDEDEDGGNNYELVANKPSASTVKAAE